MGFTCAQLFVTNKGFVYVIPMKNCSEVSQAMKVLAKEVGAPSAFICDGTREQISQKVKYFFHHIGSSMRILE